jgi:hypothetical protein
VTAPEGSSSLVVVVPHVGEALVAAPVLVLVVAAAVGVVLQVRERRRRRRPAGSDRG